MSPGSFAAGGSSTGIPRARAVLFAVLLVAATLAAYGPALRAGYIWDDDAHVTANETLRSADGLRRIWLEPTSIPQYYPLVHTTFWVEHHLWGLRPFGYHLVNVLLHAANALLVGLLLQQLRVPGAWVAAALFALHPVHVESVAWITERKNVLSTFFYLAAAWLLLRFFGLLSKPGGGSRLYALGCLFFLCALASKTVTATLPAALGLVIVWKRRRITAREAGLLVPLIAAGVAFGSATVWLERTHVGAEGAVWNLGVAERIMIAGRALWFYAGKLIWPLHLSFVYPRWTIAGNDPAGYLFPLAALAALIALWAVRRKIGAGPLVAALFFCGTLVPALGFFNVFPMRYAFVADHFQYLASVGGVALIAAAAATLGIHRLAILVVLAALAGMTFRAAGSYRDAETLWRDTLARNPAAAMAHNNLGLILAHRKEVDAAIEHYRAALAGDALLVEAEYNLGNALLAKGNADDAVRHYEHAVVTAPGDPRVRYNFGIGLIQLGRIPEAVSQLEAAVRLLPDFAAAHGALAYALARQGRDDDAKAEAVLALRLDSGMIDTRYDLADILVRQGRFDEALPQFHAILDARGDDLRARFNLGLALSRLGRGDEAVAEFDEVLRRKPDFPEARAARTAALAARGMTN